MMRAIGRLIVVPLAFLFAGLVAAFILVTLGQERLVQAFGGRGGLDGVDDTAIDAAFDILKLFLAVLTIKPLVPALMLVIVGEVARIRSYIYYIVGGGVALLAVPVIARLGQSSALALSPVTWQVFATAGFAAGGVYWLIAGHRA
jgi:hypothetical protein